MNKFCPNCGKELSENESICSNCGTILVTEESTIDKKALTGFILGLVGIIAWLIPLAGYPVCICGIVFSSKGLKSTTKKGMAIAGLVLSIVFLVFTFFNSLIGMLTYTKSIY